MLCFWWYEVIMRVQSAVSQWPTCPTTGSSWIMRSSRLRCQMNTRTPKSGFSAETVTWFVAVFFSFSTLCDHWCPRQPSPLKIDASFFLMENEDPQPHQKLRSAWVPCWDHVIFNRKLCDLERHSGFFILIYKFSKVSWTRIWAVLFWRVDKIYVEVVCFLSTEM